jgi:hypothetical protein
MNQLTDLPEEVQELLRAHEAEKIMRLEAFSQAMAKKRDEAVLAREASGIEDIWVADLEHYQGVDNANRSTAQVVKPASPAGGVMNKQGRDSNTRSTVFLNITRPYVDAIVARTCDILLPTDDANWALQPTPIPSLMKALKDKTPVPQAPMPQPPQGAMPGAPAQPQQPPPVPTVADKAMEILAAARESCEAAEKRITDWLAEGSYNAENRKVIHDSACIGVGILKGPFPDKSTAVAFVNGTLVSESLIVPRSKRVDPWNFYPDPACGESIHDGQFVFEKDYLTAKKLRELKGLSGYIAEQIDECIEEGPMTREGGDKSPSTYGRKASTDKDLYEVWYGYATVEKADLEAAGVDVDGIGLDHISAIVTMVNRRVIKAAINPLDSGAFPYDVIPWQRVAGSWAGLGVSRQMRSSQQVANAALRNMMDNAGLSGGPILIIKQGLIVPADGDWTLRPRKVFYATEDADIQRVNDAITAVNIPSMQAELQNILTFALQSCEQVTGFPLLMMGANSQTTPDTYGGQILATANASTVLRAIARNYDDCITTQHIGRYYEYLLLNGEDDSEKGDFQVIARGSSTLVEKEIQAQEQLQLIQMAGNPAFGLDPKKLMAEYLKSRRFDPRKVQYSEEEMAKMSQQPPQPAPAVQAAQIRSQASVEVAKINAQREIEKIKTEYQMELQALQQGQMSPQMASAQAQIAAAQIRADAELEKEKYRSDSELAYAQSQAAMAQANDLANMRELQLKYEIAMATLAQKHNMTLDQAKSQLAQVAMTEQTKRQQLAAKQNFDAVDYERDRQVDYEKHAQNLITNQEQAREARVAEREKQDAQHKHELEMKAKEMAALKKKATEAPGRRQ